MSGEIAQNINDVNDLIRLQDNYANTVDGIYDFLNKVRNSYDGLKVYWAGPSYDKFIKSWNEEFSKTFEKDLSFIIEKANGVFVAIAEAYLNQVPGYEGRDLKIDYERLKKLLLGNDITVQSKGVYKFDQAAVYLNLAPWTVLSPLNSLVQTLAWGFNYLPKGFLNTGDVQVSNSIDQALAQYGQPIKESIEDFQNTVRKMDDFVRSCIMEVREFEEKCCKDVDKYFGE